MGYGSERDYEYSQPLSVFGTLSADQSGGTQGGPTGVRMDSPFGQESCEYAIQAIVPTGAGTLAVSQAGRPPTVGVTGNSIPGYLFQFAGATSLPLEPCFTPLTNGELYFSFNFPGAYCSVAVLFRRHRGHVEVGEYPETFYAPNPDDELLVNEARAQAIAMRQLTTGQVVKSEPSTPGRR